jgi:hypothetical protein
VRILESCEHSQILDGIANPLRDLKSCVDSQIL